MVFLFFCFFFKQKTAYEIMPSLVGSEMCIRDRFSLILAHTNDYIPKEKFVAAGAGLQFVFGLGAMSGPFLCSIFMDLVGSLSLIHI